MKYSKLLIVIVVLQSLILLGQWTSSSILTPVQAQIPDAGSQRQQAVDELKAMNGKLDRLIGIIEGGKLQVQVSPPDEKNK